MTKTTDTSPISLLTCEEGFDPISVVAQINLKSERALPETDFMRCVRTWGGQVWSSG